MSKTVSRSTAAGPLTIGQVAELTGVSTPTLRYYEQAGLLRAISRTAAGHRPYAPAALDWLAFVMRLKATGMPIAQMQQFAALRAEGESTFGARRRLLSAHRDAVRAHIAEVQASLDAIGDKIAYYEQQERETERRANPTHLPSEQDGHHGTTR
ncbi:MerR family transcriptional regulator [Burkholderia vietnamiensis]|uniref:MerR family transcriptional regulator n=1 Tax=Burkholderia vietnamiensis TaxID=60552 RepID=UPI000D78C301|nr:MerR family transcriptional regulator [Burkholderia vietnamiensis]GBH28331.1 MerR family transcriptional regulator [Burkholderia vietnamiensis]